MSNQAVDIEILGKITRVNCPAGQEAALTQAAQDLDRRLKDMTERTKVTNELQLLTIAALNISYELNDQQGCIDDKQSQIDNKQLELEAKQRELEQKQAQLEQAQQEIDALQQDSGSLNAQITNRLENLGHTLDRVLSKNTQGQQ